MIDLFVGPSFYPLNPELLEQKLGDSKTELPGAKVEARKLGPELLLAEARRSSGRAFIPSFCFTATAQFSEARTVGF